MNTYNHLKEHLGHKMECMLEKYDSDNEVSIVCVECDDILYSVHETHEIEYKMLLNHVGHEIECTMYGEDVEISLECMDCNEVLYSETNE